MIMMHDSDSEETFTCEDDLIEFLIANMDGDRQTYTIHSYKRLPDRKVTITRLWGDRVSVLWWSE